MEIKPLPCELCGKEIMDPRRYKSHIENHQKKKDYDADAIGEVKMKMELEKGQRFKRYHCEFCGKSFTTPYTLKTHQKKSCHGGNDGHDSVILKQAYKILEKSQDLGKIREFRELIDDRLKAVLQVPDTITTTQTTNMSNQGNYVQGDRNNTIQDSFNETTNNNNTTNYNYTIAINNLNNENTQYLVDLLPNLKDQLLKIGEHDSYVKHVKKEAFEDMKKILIELYSLIHLNDDHPENQNIYITNLKQNIPFFIHVNDEWVRYGSMEHLHDVVGKTYGVLIDSLRELIEVTYDEPLKSQLVNVHQQIQDIYPLYEDQLKKNVGRQCFKLTYGNRDNICRIYKATKTPTIDGSGLKLLE